MPEASLTVRTPILRQKLDHAYVRVSTETVQGAISGGRVRAGSVMLVGSWNPGCVQWRARRGEREVGDPGAPEVQRTTGCTVPLKPQLPFSHPEKGATTGPRCMDR